MVPVGMPMERLKQRHMENLVEVNVDVGWSWPSRKQTETNSEPLVVRCQSVPSKSVSELSLRKTPMNNEHVHPRS